MTCSSTTALQPPVRLAEVDNCSRVIKYVVLYGARGDSNNLVEMSILDINVVADLTRHDPMAPNPDQPVDSDGTGTPTQRDLNDADASLTQAMASITMYWTGWWPLLHVVVTQVIQHPQSTITVQSHVAKDLLGVTEYKACSVSGNLGVLGTASEDDKWMELALVTIAPAALIMGISVAAGWLEFALHLPPPASLQIILASMALSVLAVTAVALPCLFSAYMVDSGKWSRTDAGRFLLEVGFAYFAITFCFLSTAALNLPMASQGFLLALARAYSQLAWLEKVLEYTLLAFITLAAVCLALFAFAVRWFLP